MPIAISSYLFREEKTACACCGKNRFARVFYFTNKRSIKKNEIPELIN